jgi:probable addiction module antidote protein
MAKTKTKTKTRKWDAADHLRSGRDVVAYLEAAFEDGDSGVIAAALGDVARAKGMSRVARQAGLGRESLYKALSAGGNPELGTVVRVLRALGVRLHAAPEPQKTADGLKAREREKKAFNNLTDRLADASDPTEQKRIKKELARMTYGE